MAHYQQRAFIEQVRAHFPQYFEGSKVLEVGSWNVTGSVRPLFQSCDYLGADVAAGKDVDVVTAGQDLAYPTGSFDIVISCECFEHNPFWLETFLNMARVLRPGGLFVSTCAGIGRGEHGTPRSTPTASLTSAGDLGHYYRNLSRRDFERRIDLHNHFARYAFFTNRYAKDLYFVGVKTSANKDPALAGTFDSLDRAVRRITLDKPVTLIRALGAHAEWSFKWTLSGLLGEAGYHNLRHSVRPRYWKKPPPAST